MPESFRTRWFRGGMNFWPCYRGTGGRLTFIASDWSEVRVKLGLSWRTRNYVGTIFGGSLYAAVDPFLARPKGLGALAPAIRFADAALFAIGEWS